MDKSKKHNGWSNYETWLMALHLDNNIVLYNDFNEMTQFNNDCEWGSLDMARNLNEWLSEVLTDKLDADNYLAQDIIGAFLSEVNWQEIIQNRKG